MEKSQQQHTTHTQSRRYGVLTTNTQCRRSGGVNDGGHQFEMKMAAVIGLRGLQRGDNFELFSNIKDAGNFDDLVYTAGGRRYFLQLKHADNTDKKRISEDQLVKLLLKCFRSYCDIKHGTHFKDIPIDNSEFIIYTNKKLIPTLLQHQRRDRKMDIFFATCDEEVIFSFSQENKRGEIDVYTLLENAAVNQSEEFRDTCDQEKVREFLNKVIIVTGQKGSRELDVVIGQEIRNLDVANVDNDDNTTELKEINSRVEKWCREEKGKMTAEMFSNWLQEAKTEPRKTGVNILFNSCTEHLVRTGIKFSDLEISRFLEKLSYTRAVHLRSDAPTLCNILLLDCTASSKRIFVNFESLQSNRNMLLHAWLGGHWDWLIVLCDSTVQPADISNTSLDIHRHIKGVPPNKYLIIVTARSVLQITDFVPREHEFKFEQLSDESQKMVLDKKIDFQGREVTMRSVLERHGNVQHVLGPELVTDLMTEGTTVNLGGSLQQKEGYYAPRVLERKVRLQREVLRKSNDVFAVSGTTWEDLVQIVPSGKTVKKVCFKTISDCTIDSRNIVFLLSEKDAENTLMAICEKVEGRMLHWVEFNNGELLWKWSSCGVESILDYIDAGKTRTNRQIRAECMNSGSCEVNDDSIWDLGERTVLVVAEPGMGKSSTAKKVALHTKECDPTSWVLRINWNDHTTKLQDINPTAFNFESLVEFLCSAAFPKSKYTDINSSLLKQALQNSGNITVLMDGFDEISPTHVHNAVVILSELMKTKVGRVCVTSRSVEKDRLEKELCVISWNMKTLSRESQEEMLRNLWISKEGEKNFELADFINRILSLVNRSVHDENFSGCPLYITMIATVYEEKMISHLNSENWCWSKIDLIKFCKETVERKLSIVLTEKQKVDRIDPSYLEYLKETLFNKLEKCALVAILPPTMLQSLNDKKIEAETNTFLAKVQVGEEKSGIVTNVVDGKPQFVHRTFQEYFAAEWFSKNFESNRSVMKHILFDPEFTFVRDMFDVMLARSSPLHCAVLERDEKRFETLLEKGCDVSVVDDGGRTVVHIIATRDCTFLDIINRFKPYKVSLDKRDSVLHWTPLQYAKKSEKVSIVERLLASNVDRSGLDMIRQRAHE